MLNNIASLVRPQNVTALVTFGVATYAAYGFVSSVVGEWRRAAAPQQTSESAAGGGQRTSTDAVAAAGDTTGSASTAALHGRAGGGGGGGGGSNGGSGAAGAVSSGSASHANDGGVDERVAELARAHPRETFTWVDARSGLACALLFRWGVPCGVERTANAVTIGFVSPTPLPSSQSPSRVLF